MKAKQEGDGRPSDLLTRDTDGSANHLTGADIVADVLRAFGVRAVTFVPGEGILELLDAVVARSPTIRLASFRHEAGMVYAAQAIGQVSKQPGVAFAARAPGALNTTLAIHTAFTDSAPMIMIIGQASAETSGREAMLNVDDFQRVFGPLTKWVGMIDAPERIGEVLSRAWHIAMTGRRGPVVVVLPENVAQQSMDTTKRVTMPVLPCPVRPTIGGSDLTALRIRITQARRPLLLLGGTGWDAETLHRVRALAALHLLPVVSTYRRRDLMDHADPGFVGEIGLGVDPALAKRIAAADLLVVLNGRLGELNTVAAGAFKGYTLMDPLASKTDASPYLVHIFPDGNELNAVYQADLAIQADANAFVSAWLDASTSPEDVNDALESGPHLELTGSAVWCDTDGLTARRQWRDDARRDRLAFIETGRCDGPVDLRAVYATLNATLQQDALITSGAGAYALWPQRYLQHRAFGTQLGPKSGAMGYGLPAAVGAGLVIDPHRQLLAIAGDGCLMMHVEELETAVRLGLSLLLIVINNSAYGAIDAAQKRLFGRTVGTTLGSIDFTALGHAFGASAWTVQETADFAPALQQALVTPGVKVIEIRVPSSVGKPLPSLQ